MNQTVTISQKTLDIIIDRLDELTKEVKTIKQKLAEEPPYGTTAWWEWSEKKADKDIKSGKVIKFDSVKDAIKWLNS